LRDQVDNIDDADRSGPSRRTGFSNSTGNSTVNSEATTRQHTLRGKALKNIDLVDKNYALENDLHELQSKMEAILAQNQLLQGQLTAQRIVLVDAPVDGRASSGDGPSHLRGGGPEGVDTERIEVQDGSDDGHLGVIHYVNDSVLGLLSRITFSSCNQLSPTTQQQDMPLAAAVIPQRGACQGSGTCPAVFLSSLTSLNNHKPSSRASDGVQDKRRGASE
jgi:hypothetical protein